MKRIIILGIALFCAQWMNAQTECDNMFSKAKNYYAEKDYANAKTQFQKVVKLCPSNADVSQEYIRLCDGYLGLAKQRQNQNRVDNSDLIALRQDNERLRSENVRLTRQKDSLVRIQRDSLNPQILRDCNIISERNNRIAQLVTDSTNYWQERGALFESLRELGIELNWYLEKKLNKDNKQRIQPCDGVSNDSLMGVFRENIKLVNDIKTSLFK